MPAKPKSRTLTIFLLKTPEQRPADIPKHSHTLTEFPVSIEGRLTGSIFVQPTDDRRPSWLSLFDGAVAFDYDMVRNASTAAVWLVNIEDRQVALTFGYGRNLLKSGTYEEDFGLRVTLNTVSASDFSG